MAQGSGLFGAFSRRRFREEEPSTAGPPLVAGKAAAQPGASTRPVGLFGRAFSPRGLQIIGATLQQIDGSDGAINNQLALMEEEQRRVAEEGRAMMESSWQDEQRGRLRGIWAAQDRVGAGLQGPEADRFAADPEQFLEQRGARDQYVWQRQFDNENPEAITPYQRQTLDLTRRGQDLSARATTGAGRAPPAGYRWTPDGNLEAVPGGPADIRATASGRAQAGRLQSSATSLANAIQVLDRAENMVSNDTAGVWANRTREWGLNQGATDLNEALEPVRAILSFENLAEMRRNSETGGALGSIAVRELDLLGSTIRSLSTAQSSSELTRAIQDTRTQLRTTMAAVVAAQREASGVAGQSRPGQPAQPQQARPDPLGIR